MAEAICATTASSRRARNSTPADVAAAGAGRPIGPVEGLIGAASRLADIRAPRGDAEHAPAIGKQKVAVALGAGMEDLDVWIGGSGREGSDLGAPPGKGGVGAGRHHHP